MFNCNFTQQTLTTIAPHCPNVSIWYSELSSLLQQYNITTKGRVAAFIAQAAVESQEFTHLQENLNYSYQGLLSTFPTHFTATTAAQYAHNPVAIANICYGGRYGNGPVDTGDGWKYSGKGIFQITFKGNYSAYSQWAYGDDRIVQNPDLVLQPHDAILSACWFWTALHNMNNLADADNFAQITKIINGGLNDETARVAYYNRAMNHL